MNYNCLNFDSLVEKIQQTHCALQSQSAKAVNIALTIRNWLIGLYIVEFEQNGEDRAKYGTSLIANIANNIKIKGLTAPELSRCRQFYKIYPEILGALTQNLISDSIGNNIRQLTVDQIFGLTTQKLVNGENTVLVEYASANEKDRLFVSKYKLNLPSEQELKTFIENELRKESDV